METAQRIVKIKTKRHELKTLGSSELCLRYENTKKALEETAYLQTIWDRSHTKWSRENITCSSINPMRNLRQVTAELSSRRAALSESYWKVAELNVNLEEMNLIFKGLKNTFEKDRMLINIRRTEDTIAQILEKMTGAMKDVKDLHRIYLQLKEKFDSIDSDAVEREERRSHLTRSLSQCVRDVRQYGAITKGEQEYMEQCGVNPSKAIALIQSYLIQEQTGDEYGVENLKKWISKTVDYLICETEKEITTKQNIRVLK